MDGLASGPLVTKSSILYFMQFAACNPGRVQSMFSEGIFTGGVQKSVIIIFLCFHPPQLFVHK